MKPKSWPLVSSYRERSFRIFDLRIDRSVSPRTGEAHDFIVLESAPWVNVIALTGREEVVLIRQYRHGIREVTLEVPGGLVEDEDGPRAAAQRELLEETGYRAKEWIDLGNVHPNPAIQNNRCHTFLALNAIPAKSQALDDKEDIEVVLRPLADIPRLIREGAITHSLVVCAFWRFFMEYRPAGQCR